MCIETGAKWLIVNFSHSSYFSTQKFLPRKMDNCSKLFIKKLSILVNEIISQIFCMVCQMPANYLWYFHKKMKLLNSSILKAEVHHLGDVKKIRALAVLQLEYILLKYRGGHTCKSKVFRSDFISGISLFS